MKRTFLTLAIATLVCQAASASTPSKSAAYVSAFKHPNVKVAKQDVHAPPAEEPDIASAAQAASNTHSVVLAWNTSPDAAANPAITYNAYRVTGACSSTATFTKINAAPISALTFTDASVAPGAYCYYVTAVLNGIESAPSNQAAAAILVLPPGSLVLSAK